MQEMDLMASASSILPVPAKPKQMTSAFRAAHAATVAATVAMQKAGRNGPRPKGAFVPPPVGVSSLRSVYSPVPVLGSITNVHTLTKRMQHDGVGFRMPHGGFGNPYARLAQMAGMGAEGAKGYGVVTIEPVPPRVCLMEYTGQLIDEKELNRHFQAKELAPNTFHLHGDLFICAQRPETRNLASYINQGAKPNCEFLLGEFHGQYRIYLWSTKHIPSGAELLVNYGDSYGAFTTGSNVRVMRANLKSASFEQAVQHTALASGKVKRTSSKKKKKGKDKKRKRGNKKRRAKINCSIPGTLASTKGGSIGRCGTNVMILYLVLKAIGRAAARQDIYNVVSLNKGAFDTKIVREPVLRLYWECSQFSSVDNKNIMAKITKACKGKLVMRSPLRKNTEACISGLIKRAREGKSANKFINVIFLPEVDKKGRPRTLLQVNLLAGVPANIAKVQPSAPLITKGSPVPEYAWLQYNPDCAVDSDDEETETDEDSSDEEKANRKRKAKKSRTKPKQPQQQRQMVQLHQQNYQHGPPSAAPQYQLTQLSQFQLHYPPVSSGNRNEAQGTTNFGNSIARPAPLPYVSTFPPPNPFLFSDRLPLNAANRSGLPRHSSPLIVDPNIFLDGYGSD